MIILLLIKLFIVSIICVCVYNIINSCIISITILINEITNFATEQQLLVLLMDMFMAGSDSTTNTLCFIILYILHNPHVQIRAQQELDAVTGRKRLATLNDRQR